MGRIGIEPGELYDRLTGYRAVLVGIDERITAAVGDGVRRRGCHDRRRIRVGLNGAGGGLAENVEREGHPGGAEPLGWCGWRGNIETRNESPASSSRQCGLHRRDAPAKFPAVRANSHGRCGALRPHRRRIRRDGGDARPCRGRKALDELEGTGPQLLVVSTMRVICSSHQAFARREVGLVTSSENLFSELAARSSTMESGRPFMEAAHWVSRRSCIGPRRKNKSAASHRALPEPLDRRRTPASGPVDSTLRLPATP